MSLINAAKIRRATAAMNQAMRHLDPREARLMLDGAVASLIADHWDPKQWDDVRKEHDKAVELTLQKLAEVVALRGKHE